MALPIIESPKYSTTIPSTGKAIEYRPFLVKEEKILLMAQHSSDQKEIVNAMKDIIRACTFNKTNPDDLTSFDLEFLFLKLRSKSVGETSSVKIKCEECEVSSDIDINLEEVTLEVDRDAAKRIVMLTDTVGVNLRYIRIKDLNLISDESRSQADVINDVIIASIESIFDATSVYPAENSTREELTSFINSLNRSQMQKIEEFVANTPKLEKRIAFTCKGCSHENDILISGTQSFFE